MPTLKEQQEALTKAQHHLAVWELLHYYLDTNYVTKDGRNPEKAIKVPDCLKAVVDEDTIEEILASIGTGPIQDLKQRIESIENMEVVVIDKGESDEQKG